MVKVSDFGLSKCLCKEEINYKLEHKNRKLPLRWMSIEAIEYNIFSVKSDVVRFFMYYIFSLHVNFLMTAGKKFNNKKT